MPQSLEQFFSFVREILANAGLPTDFLESTKQNLVNALATAATRVDRRVVDALKAELDYFNETCEKGGPNGLQEPPSREAAGVVVDSLRDILAESSWVKGLLTVLGEFLKLPQLFRQPQ